MTRLERLQATRDGYAKHLQTLTTDYASGQWFYSPVDKLLKLTADIQKLEQDIKEELEACWAGITKEDCDKAADECFQIFEDYVHEHADEFIVERTEGDTKEERKHNRARRYNHRRR